MLYPLEGGKVTLIHVLYAHQTLQERRGCNESSDFVLLELIEEELRIELLEEDCRLGIKHVFNECVAVGVVQRSRTKDSLIHRERVPDLCNGIKRALGPLTREALQDDLRSSCRPPRTGPMRMGGGPILDRTVIKCGRGAHLIKEGCVDDEPRLHRVKHPISLPLRQIPAHGDGHRSNLGSGEIAHHVLRAIMQCNSHEVILMNTLCLKPASQLIRSGIEFSKGHLGFVPLGVHPDQRQVIGLAFGQLAQTCSKGDRLCHLLCHVPTLGSDNFT